MQEGDSSPTQGPSAPEPLPLELDSDTYAPSRSSPLSSHTSSFAAQYSRRNRPGSSNAFVSPERMDRAVLFVKVANTGFLMALLPCWIMVTLAAAAQVPIFTEWDKTMVDAARQGVQYHAYDYFEIDGCWPLLPTTFVPPLHFHKSLTTLGLGLMYWAMCRSQIKWDEVRASRQRFDVVTLGVTAIAAVLICFRLQIMVATDMLEEKSSAAILSWCVHWPWWLLVTGYAASVSHRKALIAINLMPAVLISCFQALFSHTYGTVMLSFWRRLVMFALLTIAKPLLYSIQHQVVSLLTTNPAGLELSQVHVGSSVILIGLPMAAKFIQTGSSSVWECLWLQVFSTFVEVVNLWYSSRTVFGSTRIPLPCILKCLSSKDRVKDRALQQLDFALKIMEETSPSDPACPPLELEDDRQQVDNLMHAVHLVGSHLGEAICLACTAAQILGFKIVYDETATSFDPSTFTANALVVVFGELLVTNQLILWSVGLFGGDEWFGGLTPTLFYDVFLKQKQALRTFAFIFLVASPLLVDVSNKGLRGLCPQAKWDQDRFRVSFVRACTPAEKDKPVLAGLYVNQSRVETNYPGICARCGCLWPEVQSLNTTSMGIPGE